MGHYCGLAFDSLSIVSFKSYVPDELIALFQESDRRQVGNDPEDDDFEIAYQVERKTILERLDICGITSEAARGAFETWLAEQRATYEEYVKNGDWAAETADALRNFSFEEWARRIPDVLRTRYDFDRIESDKFIDEIDRRLRNTEESRLMFDGYGSLRSMTAATYSQKIAFVMNAGRRSDASVRAWKVP